MFHNLPHFERSSIMRRDSASQFTVCSREDRWGCRHNPTINTSCVEAPAQQLSLGLQLPLQLTTVHPWCQLYGVIGDLRNFRITPNDTKRKAKMLVTTIDWIQWNTNSTLHSAFFNALKDSTSMPTPSMTPWKKTQQICWNDLSAFANAHHLVSLVGCHTWQAFCLQWFQYKYQMNTIS